MLYGPSQEALCFSFSVLFVASVFLPLLKPCGRVFGHAGHPTVFLSGSEQSSHTSSQFSTCATPCVNTEPHVRRHSCRQPVKGGSNTLCHIHYRGSVNESSHIQSRLCNYKLLFHLAVDWICMIWT